jgi:hypothetical protein
MSAVAQEVISLGKQSLHDPRNAGHRLLAYGLPEGTGLVLVILMAVLSSLIVHLSLGMQPPEVQTAFLQVMGGPVRSAIVQLVVLLVIAAAMFGAGRMMGGRGNLPDAILLVGWTQALMIALQMVQFVVQILLPPLAGLIGLAGLFLMGWLLTGFTAALHGFASLAKTFFGMLVVMVLSVILLSFILMLFIGPQVAGAM